MTSGTNYYMDIGVVRIQSWLARTPRLIGRRGGSTLITEATDPETIERDVLRQISDVAELNEEAGRVDGVVSLKLRDPDRADEAELAVVRHLRGHMPGASLSVTTFHGGNYAKARSDNTKPSQEWPAPVAEWPAGWPCGWCGSWPAQPSNGETDQKICTECVSRSAAAGRAERREQQPYAETHLLARLGTSLAVPDTFEKLARVDGPLQTHLALVYADGNSIGTFIQEILKNRKPSKHYKLKISQKIDDATWSALVEAVQRISSDGDEYLPIVPHTVGGDDVLVSVPAHRAWEFTRTLLRSFDQHIARKLDGATGPSLSAGVVFHHYPLPLFQVTDLAKRGLRRAKVRTFGTAASVAWHDTTRDGREPVERDAVRFQDLTEHWDALTELAGKPNAARQRLAELARRFGSDSPELRDHATRVGLTPVVDRFQDAITIADALGMARWWWR